jgi:hypothetical protein
LNNAHTVLETFAAASYYCSHAGNPSYADSLDGRIALLLDFLYNDRHPVRRTGLVLSFGENNRLRRFSMRLSQLRMQDRGTMQDPMLLLQPERTQTRVLPLCKRIYADHRSRSLGVGERVRGPLDRSMPPPPAAINPPVS